MTSHVALDLYFYLNYTFTISLLYLFLKHKTKIAPGEFYRRCLFIFLLCQYSVSYPFIYSAVA